MTTPRTATVNTTTAGDTTSEQWLSGLRATGASKDDAVDRLHAMMLRVARWQVNRLRHTLGQIDIADLDVLAQQAADDATVAVLAHLDDYAGRSRFTTWAFKFAVQHASVTLRRHRWREREVPTEPQDWPYHPDPGARPDQLADAGDLAAALRAASRLRSPRINETCWWRWRSMRCRSMCSRNVWARAEGRSTRPCTMPGPGCGRS